MRVYLFGAALLIASDSSYGEYRVFELQLLSETGEEKVVRSTLDDRQYSGYHSLPPNTLINLKRSWMCRGSTSFFKPLCPPPEKEETRDPT